MRNLCVSRLVIKSANVSNELNKTCITSNSTTGEIFVAEGNSVRNLTTGEQLNCALENLGDYIIALDYVFSGLCAITRAGYMYLWDDKTDEPEMVGHVPAGITAVSWSPDQELLAATTGEHDLLLLSEDFNILREESLETKELGEKSAMTVGWGSKTTQFHGSEGKQAAKVVLIERKKIDLSCDDGSVTISWRPDGQYFTTNSVFNDERIVRVWSREASLQYTAENVTQLHNGLTWWWADERLLVGCETHNGEKRIIFFETNGLRHGEFTLIEDVSLVRQIQFASSGVCRPAMLVLLVKLKSEQDAVLIYTMNNYHWYLKQTLIYPQIRATYWDENVFVLHVLTKSDWIQYSFLSSVSRVGNNVFVIDGKNVKFTDFSKGILPPPFSHQTLTYTVPINDIIIGLQNENFGVHLANESIHIGNTVIPISGLSDATSDGSQLRFLRYFENTLYYVRVSRDLAYELCVVNINTDSDTADYKVLSKLESSVSAVLPTSDCVYVGHLSGLLEAYGVETAGQKNVVDSLPTSINFLDMWNDIIVAYSANEMKLYANGKLVGPDVTSYLVHDDGFLLATTVRDTLLIFTPESIKTTPLYVVERSVEEKSLLVTSLPASGHVILQMPRGNLETIAPRPLVIRTIQRFLNALNISAALEEIRRHRLNLNLIYDHDPVLFENNIGIFLECTPEQINLFLADLRDEDVTRTMYAYSYPDRALELITQEQKEKVNTKKSRLCKTLRDAMLARDRGHYLYSIVTCDAYTDELEHALAFLQEFPPEKKTSCLKYLCALVDSTNLLNAALGSYDRSSFVMVSEHCNKDPKEYLAFLDELSDFEENYRRYRIDMHLGRNEKAMRNLIKSTSTPERRHELRTLIRTHRLYTKALECIDDDECAKDIWADFGLYLEAKRYLKEAGLAYRRGESVQKALYCFETALQVDLALDTAYHFEVDITTVAKKLADNLKLEKRWNEAANLMHRFPEIFSKLEIAEMLIQGCQWILAGSAVSSISDSQLRKNIRFSMMEAWKKSIDELLETIESHKNEFVLHLERLRVVRHEGLHRGAVDDVNYDDGDDGTFSEVGSVATRSSFSRHSKTASNVTHSSLVTANRNERRRQKKPKYTLKAGSRYEEFALMIELSKIVSSSDSLADVVCDATTFGVEYNAIEDSRSLQTAFGELVQFLEKSIDEIWKADEIREIVLGDPALSKPVLSSRYDVASPWCLALFSNK